MKLRLFSVSRESRARIMDLLALLLLVTLAAALGALFVLAAK